MPSVLRVSSFFLFVVIISINDLNAGENFDRFGYNSLDGFLSNYFSRNGDENQLLNSNNADEDRDEDQPSNKVINDYNLMMNTDLDKKLPLEDKNNLELNFFNLNNNQNSKYFDNHEARDEEILEKSSLWRHQLMQGGAGEGEQKLKPDGSIKNIQVIKSDSIVPSFCTPPNPCPEGYTSEDGCIENFVNTASFSREFQSRQNCMCDTEHMFSCNTNDSDKTGDEDEEEQERKKVAEEERELNAIARSIANQPIGENTANQLINNLLDHKVVAKKFFSKRTSS